MEEATGQRTLGADGRAVDERDERAPAAAHAGGARPDVQRKHRKHVRQRRVRQRVQVAAACRDTSLRRARRADARLLGGRRRSARRCVCCDRARCVGRGFRHAFARLADAGRRRVALRRSRGRGSAARHSETQRLCFDFRATSRAAADALAACAPRDRAHAQRSQRRGARELAAAGTAPQRGAPRHLRSAPDGQAAPPVPPSALPSRCVCAARARAARGAPAAALPASRAGARWRSRAPSSSS